MATRNLRITSCKEVYRGNGAKGEFVIYEVEAVNADTGVLVNLPLRSFNHLSDGEVGQFEVEKYERPGKETTYTLKKPRGAGGGGNSLGPKVDELRRRIELVEENLKTTQANLQNLIGRFEQQNPPAASGGSIHSSGAPSLAGPAPDDEIPF